MFVGLLSFGRSWSIEIAGYKKFYWRRQSAERSPGLLWRNCRATGPCLGRCAIATRRIPGFGKCRSAKGRRFAFGEAFDFRWDTVKVVNLIIDKLSYNFERLAARKSFCACHLHGCQNAFGFCNANETCAKRCLSLPFCRNQGREKSLAPMRAAFENTEISKDDISWNCGGKRVSMKKCDCQFKGVRQCLFETMVQARTALWTAGKYAGAATPWESARGSKPFCAFIVPDGLYGGDGAILTSGNSISRRKSRFLAIFASGNSKSFSGNCKGWPEPANPRDFAASPKAKLPRFKF